MSFPIQSVAKELCRLSAEVGVGSPGATRLVKLLYLGDLEWRRGHGGAPLFNCNWIFWHFGPYAMEFAEVFGSNDVETIELNSGKTAKCLSFSWDDLRKREVPEDVTRVLKGIVGRWAGEDLNRLLDYVYFETEPMENVRRGESLDFSKLAPLPKMQSPNINAGRLNELRESVKRRVGSLGIRRKPVDVPLVVQRLEAPWKEEFSGSQSLREGTVVKQSLQEK